MVGRFLSVSDTHVQFRRQMPTSPQDHYTANSQRGKTLGPTSAPTRCSLHLLFRQPSPPSLPCPENPTGCHGTRRKTPRNQVTSTPNPFSLLKTTDYPLFQEGTLRLARPSIRCPSFPATNSSAPTSRSFRHRTCQEPEFQIRVGKPLL